MKQFRSYLPMRLTLLAFLLALSGAMCTAALACPIPEDATAAHTGAAADLTVEVPAPPQVRRLVLRETGGMVCVYENGVLLYQTDIPVVSLPAQDREKLVQGIEVETEEEMHQLLEDLGS